MIALTPEERISARDALDHSFLREPSELEDEDNNDSEYSIVDKMNEFNM